MEDIHRTIIQTNHNEMLNNCDFPRLLPKLVKNKVFTKDQIKTYEKCDNKCKVNLLFDLLGRGPDAFDNFALSLKESNQGRLANKLLGIKDTSPVRTHTVPIFPNNIQWSAIDINTDRLRIQVVPSERFMDDFGQITKPYTMRSKSRGAVLIINNEIFDHYNKRNGAQVDKENLMELFRQMGGYNVTLLENRTSVQMESDIITFSKRNVLKSVDVMFVIIMSHGGESGNESEVMGVDGISIRTSLIEHQFYGDNCPYMQNKPKIILYQICRGTVRDSGIRKTETDGLGIGVPTRRHSDLLVCHSTSQGYSAHRDVELGSWYIQCLCETLMKYAYREHVETLLHLVDERLSTLQSHDEHRTMQTSTFNNLGFRHCFLNPGIYEENKQFCRYNG